MRINMEESASLLCHGTSATLLQTSQADAEAGTSSFGQSKPTEVPMMAQERKDYDTDLEKQNQCQDPNEPTPTPDSSKSNTNHIEQSTQLAARQTPVQQQPPVSEDLIAFGVLLAVPAIIALPFIYFNVPSPLCSNSWFVFVLIYLINWTSYMLAMHFAPQCVHGNFGKGLFQFLQILVASLLLAMFFQPCIYGGNCRGQDYTHGATAT